jgi:hypothetical protein
MSVASGSEATIPILSSASTVCEPLRTRSSIEDGFPLRQIVSRSCHCLSFRELAHFITGTPAK